MKFWDRGGNPAEKRPNNPTDRAVKYLAGLAMSAEGSLRDALDLGLAEMEPAERAAALLRVLEGLPAVMRACILGDIGMSTGAWHDVRETMTAEERRPLLVRALLDRSTETKAVDLASIPAGVAMQIDLYQRSTRKVPLPEQVDQYERLIALSLYSLGEGIFETHTDINLRRSSYIHKDMTVRLGGYTADRDFTPTVRFGKSLVAIVVETSFDEVNAYGRSQDNEGCFVGRLTLDGQPAFGMPPAR